jgi:hypothetical protein
MKLQNISDQIAGPASVRAGRWSRPGVPHRGWSCVDVEDLGEPNEICEMCEQAEVRYVHVMQHAEWEGELRVGCICAGRMEQDYKRAVEREAELKRVVRKMKRELKRGYEWDYAWERMLAQRAEEAEVWQSWIVAADEILERAERGPVRLGSRELEFVRDMRGLAGTRRSFSQKQMQWFRAIYLRVVGRKEGEQMKTPDQNHAVRLEVER